MSADPDDLGQGPGGGNGGTGTPTPDPRDAEVERLKQENAKLREERREERARALGAEHGLTPGMTDLLKLLPADQMEEKAKALAAERAPASGAPPGDGGQPTPPAEPPAGATGAPPADPNLQDFEKSGGQPPPDPSLSWQDELSKEIAGANSLEELADIQRKYRERQRSGQLG
jgi:hypothetical protein